MKESSSLRRSALALALLSLSGSALAATCASAHPDEKTHKLYLLFPSAPLSYPSFGFSAASATDPAARFSAADLPGFSGSTEALRAAITDAVAQDYCGLNVQVLDTASLPPAIHAHRNIVAVTTASDVSEGLFGYSQTTDVGDREAVDYSYVWAKTYQDWAGGALSGANSTLQRWANAIAGTAAHESGHNYGLAHSAAIDKDDARQHLMAAGSGIDADTRAGGDRYFGDREYSWLAANLGLSMQTMWNWELVNPNATAAHSIELRVLHPSRTAPSLDGAYAGCGSPWLAPVVTGPVGPAESAQGGTYYPYLITWSAPNPAWGTGECAGAAGAPGQAAGGARFYVGASFMASQFDLSTSESLLLQSVVLRDGAGKAMGLNPRVHAFDAGSFDEAGNWNIGVSNPGPVPLRVQNLRIRELARPLAQEQLTARGRLLDLHGRDVLVWPGGDREFGGTITPPAEAWTVPAGKVGEERHDYDVVDASDCDDSFLRIVDTKRCGSGAVVGLFPSTAVYFTADSTDTQATYWDPGKRQYLRGALTTRTYYQLSGHRLDRNRNGIDDYIEARQGK
jgi:hypothetical protein